MVSSMDRNWAHLMESNWAHLKASMMEYSMATNNVNKYAKVVNLLIKRAIFQSSVSTFS